MGADKKKPEAGPAGMHMQLDWVVPESLPIHYATNMVVQRLEHEYVISFFEVRPPILLGDPAEIAKKIEEMKQVPAVCVGQFYIAADKMPAFVKVLQDNLNVIVPSEKGE